MENSSINNNSIWPNGLKTVDGYWTFIPLGENKHDMPTGITETETQKAWPKGDVLISPFVYKDGKLVGFCDTKSLNVPTSTDPDSSDVKFDTLMPYDYIQVEFTSLTKDDIALYAPHAKTVKIKWKDTNSFETILVPVKGGGTFTYAGCIDKAMIKTTKTNYLDDIVDGTWSEKLWDLIDGTALFGAENSTNANSDIKTFNSDLPFLTTGRHMFRYCKGLTTFNGDLSSLKYGTFMFHGCTNLSTFNCSDLSSLIDAHLMFVDCYSLTTFSCELKNIENGNCMFYMSNKDNANFVSFNSDLSSLKCATGMFNYCKLDAASVQNIVSTIKDVKDVEVDNEGKISFPLIGSITAKQITIGMGCNNDKEEIDANLFAQEAGYDNMRLLEQAFTDKGWTVYTQYNGRPATTYDLRRPSASTLPVFVKLEEDEEHGHYMSEDGSKKFRLDWFHKTTGSTNGYTQFNTIEEAIESLNIKPIEN